MNTRDRMVSLAFDVIFLRMGWGAFENNVGSKKRNQKKRNQPK